ncbi:MAG: winged helix-turn-helix domain-containing protein [Anaerolineae bacterium]|jgi:pSer/pThr/pTyr-binding forkhead associated (FHA) protein
MKDNERSPFLTGPTGREHPLRDDAVIIGRAVESDIVITSRRVSREHARLRREGWRVILHDLGSTNGTFLNDERVLSPVELRDADRIRIGDVTFVFHDPAITIRETPFPQLEVDVAAGVVRLDRRRVELSAKEFALLAYLYEQRGQVCSKDDIATAVWPEYEGDVYDYQVENLVHRLRQSLEYEPSNPQVLVTVRGLGYKLVAASQ